MKKEETFEELLNKLETITSKLEKEDDISLDESMKLFEKGIANAIINSIIEIIILYSFFFIYYLPFYLN